MYKHVWKHITWNLNCFPSEAGVSTLTWYICWLKKPSEHNKPSSSIFSVVISQNSKDGHHLTLLAVKGP